MERKGLNCIYGAVSAVLAMLFLIFGGYLLIPLFGEKGALLAGIPIAALGIVMTLISGTKLSEVMPFKLPPVKSFFGALLLYIGLTNATNVYSVILGSFVDISARNDSINAILQKMSPFTALLLTALLPALCEEFFCRGFLLRCFSGIKKKWVLILLIAAIFGAMHLDLVSFIPTAVFGGLMCYIAIKTGSLLIPMLLHFINNAYSVVLLYTSSSSSNDGLAISDLYFLQVLSLVVLYCGIAVIAVYAGARLITGKKFFTKCLVVAVSVALLLIIVGYALLTVGSMKFVQVNTSTAEYSEEINEVVPLKITEKGSYIIALTVYSDDEINAVFCCGDENLTKETGKGYVQLIYNFEYTEGDCYFKITDNSDNALDGGELSMNYIVIRINV